MAVDNLGMMCSNQARMRVLPAAYNENPTLFIQQGRVRTEAFIRWYLLTRYGVGGLLLITGVSILLIDYFSEEQLSGIISESWNIARNQVSNASLQSTHRRPAWTIRQSYSLFCSRKEQRATNSFSNPFKKSIMAKVWFVTGASRGLGRKIVEAALQAGDSVVAAARKPEQLDDLVQQYGQHVFPVALDVADKDQVLQAVKAGHEALGRYDVVVNNAGYGDTAAVEDTTIDSFHAQINTNLFGVIYVSKAVLPILREQGSGHIFQVSSVGGRIGSVGLAGYQSAKWAVGGFSVILAQEVAPLGIQVTCLEPGGMQTDWAGSSMTIPPVSAPYEQTVGKMAAMLKQNAGQEPTSPAKVAGVIQQLANNPNAPVRLLLGADAVQYASEGTQALAASDAKWIALSTSVTR